MFFFGIGIQNLEVVSSQSLSSVLHVETMFSVDYLPVGVLNLCKIMLKLIFLIESQAESLYFAFYIINEHLGFGYI